MAKLAGQLPAWVAFWRLGRAWNQPHPKKQHEPPSALAVPLSPGLPKIPRVSLYQPGQICWWEKLPGLLRKLLMREVGR